MEQEECILCVEPVKIAAISECNHSPICYLCMIKIRIINKNPLCPICKQKSTKIILTTNVKAQYQDFELKTLKIIQTYKDQDLLYQTEDVRAVVESTKQFQCFIVGCQNTIQYAQLYQLKQHLQRDHEKYLCDVCIDAKTCILKEQILYTHYELRNHQNKGDVDEDGNVIFKHPYCSFCQKSFYDEDKFKSHLNQAHINCSLCNNKYKFYKDHASYEKHLKFSHYACDYPQCKENLVVYNSAIELEMHNMRIHHQDSRIKNMINSKSMAITGFYDQQQQQQLGPLDNEGQDFEDQFISLRRTKMIAIGEIDEHKDEQISLKQVLPQDYNDEYDRNLDLSESKLQQKEYFLEDLIIYKKEKLPHLQFKGFFEKCLKFTKEEGKLKKMIQDVESQRYPNIQFFVEDFLRLFNFKTGIRLLQFYIVSRDMKEQRQSKLAEAIENEMYKMIGTLKMNKETILLKSKYYSDLFKNLLNQLDINLRHRIEQGVLTDHKDTMMEREKIGQLVSIIRHIKTQEMGRFQFASNFGISVATLDILRKKILNEDVKYIQQNLDLISNQEFLPVYLYVSQCYKILIKEAIFFDRNSVDRCVYIDFLNRNPQLGQKLKKQDDNNKQQPVQNNQIFNNQTQSKQPQQKKQQPQKQQQQASSGFQYESLDFPSLPVTKSVNKAQNIGFDDTSVMLLQGQTDMLRSEFPSLDETMSQKQVQQQEKKKKPPQPPPPTQAQTQQLGVFKIDESFVPIDKPMEIKKIEVESDAPWLPKKDTSLKEVAKIKKKGKTKVIVAGGFM